MPLDCPRCRRPVAVARQHCLYCGADLSALVPASGRAEPAPARAVTDAPSDRMLVIVALDGADAEHLRAAFGLSSYEAAQWARRGGYHLHRVAAPVDADAERERLTAQGIVAFSCAEAEVRAAADPQPAIGGAFDGAALRLRLPRGTLAIEPSDLRLVVKGPITREHPVTERLRFARTATLEPGYRFHLHRREDRRPVEIDPAGFDFGAARAGEGSLLEISGWIAALAAAVPVDDGFRRVTPALAPVIPVPGAASKPEDALRTGPAPLAAILDNLAQFRFYSAWRGAVEREARPR